MLIDVVVPPVGESISEVDIGQWQKLEGAAVRRDDTLVIVETDKASLEIPAPESGMLTKILKQTGDRAGIGEVIARIEQDKAERPTDEGGQQVTKDLGSATPPHTGEKTPHGAEEGSSERKTVQSAGISAFESAEDFQTQNSHAMSDDAGEPREASLQGGAPRDSLPIIEHYEPPAPSRPPPSHTHRAAEPWQSPEPTANSRVAFESRAQDRRAERAVPMTALRRRIAERLVQARQTAALLTTFNEIDMSRVVRMREQYREPFEQKHKVKLGIMSFFVKAVVSALQSSPEINAEIRGDQIIYRDYYDIGVAVGGGKGLVVPVLRDAERMSFAEIEQAIADFSRRAREARLNPEDLEGGTFTITNGGIYGSLLSTPIVNPPQTAILGMHAIQDRPVARNGAVLVRPMMYVALTYDHRLVDGREAVSFLRHIKEAVEEPARVLFDL
jgi:2-oxoglutarate dehydrogenase E2 component (dihydrolipoamide succinyltransferase)